MSPFVSIPLYLALSVLIGFLTERCLRRWKRTSGNAGTLRKFWLIPYIALSLMPVAGTLLPDSPLRFALQAVGNVWLGFYVYYGGLLLLFLLLSLLLRLLSRGRLAAGWHGGILCLTLALAAATAVYGLIHAQHTVVDRYELALDKPGEDMKVVLIADLHLSVNSSLSTIQRMVELVNEEQPDLVLVGGDIFTSSYGGLSHPEAYAAALRGMEAKYGVYAVYGNHDVEEPLFCGFSVAPVSRAFRPPEMERFFRDCGFITLADEVVSLETGALLAGRIDKEKAGDGTRNRMSAEELLADADKTRPILVLEHEPVEYGALKAAGADVALSGHTHAGQLFPGNYVVPFFNENTWGYAEIRGLHTFVTSGVGYFGPPMRVGTNSEIMVIQLHFAGKQTD